MNQKKPSTPFYLIDTSHPFYRPLGVRLAIVALTIAWAALEISIQSHFFIVISLSIAAYCTWVLLIRYTPPEPPPPPRPVEDDPEEEDDQPPR